MFRLLLACCCWLALPGLLLAQRPDLKVLGRWRVIELPFTIENDFIILNVVLDNVIPLRFIVDTGAENSVLLEKEITDLLDVDYQRKFEVRGSDVETPITAYLATGIDLRIANRILARNRTMLVLEDNYFDFERITGVAVQGILGVDFLMRFTVEFDYRRQVIVLHEPNKWAPGNQHEVAPADFVRNRAYLNLPLLVATPPEKPRRLLLDTGAGLSVLLHTYGDSTDLDLPQQTVTTYIGNGLGGTLEGNVGRSRQLKIAGKELNNVITYFQPVDTVGASFLNERDGIIGNRLLKRFNLVVDFPRRKVWLKPVRRRWKQKFAYDRSGLSIIAGGANLRNYRVATVVPGSPAAEQGIRVGDRIVGVNGQSATFLTLGSIIRKLEGKVGKRIKLRIRRGGEYFVAELRLRDLI